MSDELKGRIEILEQQRNDAMNQSVLLGGQIKQMIEQIEGLQKKIKDLEPENGVDQEIENTES